MAESKEGIMNFLQIYEMILGPMPASSDPCAILIYASGVIIVTVIVLTVCDVVYLVARSILNLR